MTTELRLGTRGSQLALWQANTVAARIAEAGGPPCRIVIIRTSGDRLQDVPLSSVGGKRLFVKEIEDALLRDEIDLAVHSSKDMPAILPEGLAIAGVLPREDPLDAIVLRLPLTYGPRVKGNFLTLLDAVARCARLPFGRIGNRRDFLYIGNLVHAIAGLLDAPGPVGGAWLAADGEAVSTAELVRRIASALGVEPRVVNVPAPLLSIAAQALGRGALLRRTVASLEVDASPLAMRVGPPSFTLDQGLAATTDWWRLRHSI